MPEGSRRCASLRLVRDSWDRSAPTPAEARGSALAGGAAGARRGRGLERSAWSGRVSDVGGSGPHAPGALEVQPGTPSRETAARRTCALQSPAARVVPGAARPRRVADSPDFPGAGPAQGRTPGLGLQKTPLTAQLPGGGVGDAGGLIMGEGGVSQDVPRRTEGGCNYLRVPCCVSSPPRFPRAPRLQGAPAPPPPHSSISFVWWAPDGWLLPPTVEGTGSQTSAPSTPLPHLAVARTPGARLKGSWGAGPGNPKNLGVPFHRPPSPHPQRLGRRGGRELFPLPPLCHRRGGGAKVRPQVCGRGAAARARPYLAISAPPGKPRPRQSRPRPPRALSHRPGGRRK